MSLKYEVIKISGHLVCHRHGRRHRVDGPASLWTDGDVFWYQHGKSHRIGGPAEIYHGKVCYFIMGKQYTREEYESKK